MNILHIGKYYPPFNGGIEKVNCDLVESLNCKQDCHVDELCFHHSTTCEPMPEPSAYKVFRAPIRAIRFSTPISINFYSLYRKIRNDYDIIHIHLPNPTAAIAPLIFRTRGKLILHWHSDILKQNKLKLLYRPLQTLLLKRAARIIVTSRCYFDASEDLQPYADKVCVIPIGIDTEHLAYTAKDVAVIKERYFGKKIILSIGRLTYYKGFEYLIDAAKSLAEDTIVLIGGSGENRSVLQTYIDETGLNDRVKLIGRIPQQEMGAYFVAADLFCLPSIVRTEAFGVVLLEALAMGLPIVACNISGSGVSWVNSHKETGLNVPVRDSVAIAAAIKELLDEKVKAEYRNRCRKRYETLFLRNKMVDDVYTLYKSIIDGLPTITMGA